MPNNSKQPNIDTSWTCELSTLVWTTSSDYELNSDEAKELDKSNREQIQSNAFSITNYFLTNTKSYLGILNE